MINDTNTQQNHIIDATSINSFANINIQQNQQHQALNNDNSNNSNVSSSMSVNNVYQDVSASLYPHLMPYNPMLVISNPAPNFLNFDPSYNHPIKSEQPEYLNQYENKQDGNSSNSYPYKLENVASDSYNASSDPQQQYQDIRSLHPQAVPVQQQITISSAAVGNGASLTTEKISRAEKAKKKSMESSKRKTSVDSKRKSVASDANIASSNVSHENFDNSSSNKQKKSVNSKDSIAKRSCSQTDNDWKLLHENIDLFTLNELADVIRQSESKETKKIALDSINSRNLSSATDAKLTQEEFIQLLATIPKSRRQQLFGGLFLKQACKVSKDEHIPRSRIYAKYVNSCAQHNVASLSPPLFGKLIKIIFPFITIHRYGVRGQTKYHYCGITLIDSLVDKQSTNISNNLLSTVSTPNSPASGPNTPYGFVVNNHEFISHSEVSSPLRSLYDIDSPVSTVMSPVVYGNNNYINQHNSHTTDIYSKEVDYIIRSLGKSCFVAVSFQNKLFEVPKIEPYIPVHLRHSDSVSTLVSLYKYHCFSIFEAIRLMKVNSLTSIIGSFQKSLTSPVAKLYSSPQILPWILKCDLKLYQSILSTICESIFTFNRENFVNLSSDTSNSIHEISKIFTKLVSESVNNLPKRLGVLKTLLAKKFSKSLARIVEIDKLSISVMSSNNPMFNFNYVDLVDVQNIVDDNNILQDHHHNSLIINSNPTTLYDHEDIINDMSKNNSVIAQMIGNAFKNDVSTLLKSPINNHFINQWLNYFIKFANDMTQKGNFIIPEMFVILINFIFDGIIKELSFSEVLDFNNDIKRFMKLKCFTIEWISWYGEMNNFCRIFDTAVNSNNLANINLGNSNNQVIDDGSSALSGSTAISGSSTPISNITNNSKKRMSEEDLKTINNYPPRKIAKSTPLNYVSNNTMSSDKDINFSKTDNENNAMIHDKSHSTHSDGIDERKFINKISDQSNNSNSTLISDISNSGSMFLSIENLDSSTSTNIRSHNIDLVDSNSLVDNVNEKEIMNFFN